MKMFVYLFLACLLLVPVSAIELQDACLVKGFDHSMSDWMYNGSWIQLSGEVDVLGTARKINWSSSEYVDGVVYKSNGRTYVLEGGFNGTVPKTVLTNDFEWVSFCSASSVPEFTIFGIAIVVILCGLFYRKLYK